jgi:hypothetical protein
VLAPNLDKWIYVYFGMSGICAPPRNLVHVPAAIAVRLTAISLHIHCIFEKERARERAERARAREREST